MKITTLTALAAAAALIALAAPAGAIPALPKANALETATIVPVADGCGRGWHYSWRLRRCVRNARWWR